MNDTEKLLRENNIKISGGSTLRYDAWVEELAKVEKEAAEKWLAEHKNDGDPRDIEAARLAITKANVRGHVAEGSHRHGK